jgi:hypothetical protein
MSPVGFEIPISAGERPQTYGLDRTATGTGYVCRLAFYILFSNTYVDLKVCNKCDVAEGVFCNPCVVTSGLGMFFRIILKWTW